jgi:hypothetical protein
MHRIYIGAVAVLASLALGLSAWCLMEARQAQRLAQRADDNACAATFHLENVVSLLDTSRAGRMAVERLEASRNGEPTPELDNEWERLSVREGSTCPRPR